MKFEEFKRLSLDRRVKEVNELTLQEMYAIRVVEMKRELEELQEKVDTEVERRILDLERFKQATKRKEVEEG